MTKQTRLILHKGDTAVVFRKGGKVELAITKKPDDAVCSDEDVAVLLCVTMMRNKSLKARVHKALRAHLKRTKEGVCRK